MHILIVDDSKPMRQIVARELRKAGISGLNISEAEDGEQGLQTCLSVKPDIVFSDWNMPNRTGISFLKTLREMGNTTPFVFVTSEGSEDMRATAYSSGASNLVTKPFSAEVFAAVVHRIQSGDLSPPPIVESVGGSEGPKTYDKKNPLPIAEDVDRLLSNLIGKKTSTLAAKPFNPKAGTVCAAEYLSDEGELCAVAFCDIPFAASVGAALAMVPQLQMRAAIATNQLVDPMRANAYEVFNVLADQFNISGAPHVRLTRFIAPPDKIPPELDKYLVQRTSRQDFQVDVTMYGVGGLVIVIV